MLSRPADREMYSLSLSLSLWVSAPWQREKLQEDDGKWPWPCHVSAALSHEGPLQPSKAQPCHTAVVMGNAITSPEDGRQREGQQNRKSQRKIKQTQWRSWTNRQRWHSPSFTAKGWNLTWAAVIGEILTGGSWTFNFCLNAKCYHVVLNYHPTCGWSKNRRRLGPQITLITCFMLTITQLMKPSIPVIF